MSNPVINDFVLNVATVNGSGSQSSNQIILKSLFRMGIPSGGKNLFPSNIAGLPTWFGIRVSKDGYIGRRSQHDITIAMNPDTIAQDVKELRQGGVFIYNEDLKFDRSVLRSDVTNIAVPFRKIVDGVTQAIKLKKFFTNMVYVGVISKLLDIDMTVVKNAARDQFGAKATQVLEDNFKAIQAGYDFAAQNVTADFPYKVKAMNKTQGKIIIDGNTSAALGSIWGGCTFVSWYPITPSSSLAETFTSFSYKLRKGPSGENNFAIVQAEDELSAIGMVLGASWSGARAMTATSGPGFSLMSEFAGYSYYAEIPAVIWNIQRAGPSTGLPTRTAQGDVLKAATLSHGDTRHVLLFPSSPHECFEFGQTSFDLAERLQTLVFVMSDLDLGMNLWIDDPFVEPTKPYDRGKVLSAEDLETRPDFGRYTDTDGDGIPYRTLPGTQHERAAFFTRGSGHDEKARYTESNEAYERVLNRLKKKFDTARTLVPKPEMDLVPGAEVGLIAYGSTDIVMKEARDLLAAKGVRASYMRVRAYPFSAEVHDFVKRHKRVYVVEQNRDAQLRDLLVSELHESKIPIRSILHYDGLPIHAATIVEQFLQNEKAN